MSISNISKITHNNFQLSKIQPGKMQLEEMPTIVLSESQFNESFIRIEQYEFRNREECISLYTTL